MASTAPGDRVALGGGGVLVLAGCLGVVGVLARLGRGARWRLPDGFLARLTVATRSSTGTPAAESAT